MGERALVVAVGCTVIVIGGLTGCSSDKSASENASSATETAKTAMSSATSAATSATEAAKGILAWRCQGLHRRSGPERPGYRRVYRRGGNIQIAIGDATQGLGAQLSDADPPQVKQVGLGNVGGTALGYAAGAPGGEASATKDGNTYKIKGTATGVDGQPDATPDQTLRNRCHLPLGRL